jgi:hypothetical protein
MQIFMLAKESSEATMLLISTAELFRFSISWTADNLMPFPFNSVLHLRFLRTVSQFWLRLFVPSSPPTNLAFIRTQFDIKNCVVSLQVNINLKYI